MKLLTVEKLKTYLSYDPNTGVFINLHSGRRKKAGGQAGTIHKSGYRKIGINGEIYYEHQLAWLYITGKLPRTTMFHIDGVKTNNRFDNLLDIPRSLIAKTLYGRAYEE